MEELILQFLIELFIWIIKGVLIILVMLFVGLLLEKACHQNESTEWIVSRFKGNLVIVFTVLLGKNQTRHIFKNELFEEMKDVADPYRCTGFEDAYRLYKDNYTPCFDFIFVPRPNLGTNDLQTVTDLLLLKFRDYLCIYDLPFETFATYAKIQGRVYVRIYYAELKEDKKAIKKRYQQAIREKTGIDRGILRDDTLDKELDLC